jgi:LysM repeat protein
MKTQKTYPTRHPHWIDDPEQKNPNWISRLNKMRLSFTGAFVIVLGLHLALIAGIYTWGNLRSKILKPRAAITNEVPEQSGPASDSLAKNEWPQSEATPVVKALSPAPKKVAEATAKTIAKEHESEKRPTAKVAEKKPEPVKTPERVVSTPTKTQPPSPAKTNDTALREQFLAARNATNSREEVTEVRQAIPVKTVVAQNSETPLPPKSVAANSAPPKPEAARENPPTPAVTEYTLSGGDNLYAVSRRLQVSYNDLLEANGITDPRQLRVGQKLKVPQSKSDS